MIGGAATPVLRPTVRGAPFAALPTLVLLLTGLDPLVGVGEAHAQQCLGRPIEAGEHTIGARLDLDELRIVAGEYAGAATDVAWSVMAGAASRQLIPPDDFALALGGALAWTGFHRTVCPSGSFWTTGEDGLRRTRARLGVGLGRRLGERRVRGAAFLFPHARIVRDDQEFQGEEIDNTRHEFWLDGGFSLRGQELWVRVVLGLQLANYLPGEDVIDGSLRLAGGWPSEARSPTIRGSAGRPRSPDTSSHSGYSSFRQARNSSVGGFGVRSSRNQK